MSSPYHIRTNMSVGNELFEALEYILYIRERYSFLRANNTSLDHNLSNIFWDNSTIPSSHITQTLQSCNAQYMGNCHEHKLWPKKFPSPFCSLCPPPPREDPILTRGLMFSPLATTLSYAWIDIIEASNTSNNSYSPIIILNGNVSLMENLRMIPPTTPFHIGYLPLYPMHLPNPLFAKHPSYRKPSNP